MLFWEFWESAVVCSGRRCVDVRILLQITLMSSLVRLDHTSSVQSMALVCIVRLVCFHSCSVLLRVLCLTSHRHHTQSVLANLFWTLMAFSNTLGGPLQLQIDRQSEHFLSQNALPAYLSLNRQIHSQKKRCKSCHWGDTLLKVIPLYLKSA